MDPKRLSKFLKKKGEENLLGRFKAKDGLDYLVIKDSKMRDDSPEDSGSENDWNDFVISAYDLSGIKPEWAGYWRCYVTNGRRRDPIRFLELPAEAGQSMRMEPFVEVFEPFRQKGIADALMPYTFVEFRKRGAFVVGCYRPGVAEWMLDKYLREGFAPARVIHPELMPEHMRENTDWVYKDYWKKG